MKSIKFKIMLIFLFVFSVMQASNTEGKFKKTKIITKSFDVSNISSVHINNSFGNININTWNENVALIKVTIEATGDYEEELPDVLEKIQVKLFQKAEKIYGITNLDNISDPDSWSWSIWSIFRKKNHKTGYKINYDIKMPVNLDLSINSEYGDIYIDILNGNLDLKADFGRFDFGELNGDNNRIDVEYFSSSNIDFIKNARINADYSKINIINAYSINVTADYTNLKIDKIEKINFSNDYGSIKIKDAMWIKGRGDYQTRYFSNLKYLDFKGDYGWLKIEKLRPDFEKINLVCNYTDVKIINTSKVPFQLHLHQEYGSFKNENIEVYKYISDMWTTDVDGYYKDKNVSSVININMNYNTLKIKN